VAVVEVEAIAEMVTAETVTAERVVDRPDADRPVLRQRLRPLVAADP
jgi:hypothetical protein